MSKSHDLVHFTVDLVHTETHGGEVGHKVLNNNKAQ